MKRWISLLLSSLMLLSVCACNGPEECKKALTLLKVGRLPEDFIEGMICTGGCVNGPGSLKSAAKSAADRNKLVASLDDRDISGSLDENKDIHFEMHRDRKDAAK